MQKENLFEKVSFLKEKFRTLFQQKKKVKALENYSEAEPVGYGEEVKLIKHCMANRFLSKKGADFLEELLEENRISYLEWAHRTKWLKKEIAYKRAKRKQIEQTFFDFESRNIPVDIPINIINSSQNSYLMRL